MAEVHYGLYRMANGKRKQKLLIRFQHILDNVFNNSILTFDGMHSSVYARIRANRDAKGKPMSSSDAQIA